MDLCEQSPSYIRAIAPYQPGKPIPELAREMGLDEKKIIKLASNENPLGVSPKAKAAIKKALAEIGRYPDGNAFELKAALARRYGVPEECIVVGNGSNDLLEMAAGVFLAPGREKHSRRHLQEVVRAVADDDAFLRNAVAARERRLQLEGVAVGITPDLGEHFLDRRLRLRRYAERILVRGELDDFFFVQPHLAGELRDRLARQIRRDGANVGRRQLAKIHAAP